MPAIYGQAIGHREAVLEPVVAQTPDSWNYGSLVTAAGWTDEGGLTPGTLAAVAGTPTPLVGLPGATVAADAFVDANSERNTSHLAMFAWIRPTTIVGADRFIVGKLSGSTGFRWYIRSTVTQQYLVAYTAGGTVVFTENVTSISLNTWQQVGAIWNPDTNYATFFHNGVATRSATGVGGTGAIVASSVDMRIGTNAVGGSPFAGDLALPRNLDARLLPHIDEYARHPFESERHIFGV